MGLLQRHERPVYVGINLAVRRLMGTVHTVTARTQLLATGALNTLFAPSQEYTKHLL